MGSQDRDRAPGSPGGNPGDDGISAEERLRWVSRATNDAVWDWNITTRQVWWNEAMESLFGYRRDEVSGDIDWWGSLIHPDDRERVLEDLTATLDGGGESWQGEYRFRKADGSYAFVLDRGWVARREDGRPVRMIGAMMDITPRVQLEEELLQARKLEAVGRLAGGVAHDFNNLLTAILGYAELALRRLPAGAGSPREEIEEIERAGRRAAELTRQLLAFGRRQILRPRVVDLNGVVGGTERMLRSLLGEKVEVVFLLDPELSPVRVDPGQMEQVLVNLALNARDAMPDGGRLVVETADVELSRTYSSRHEAAVTGPCVLLAVTDTGTGIPEGIRGRIFEPFFTTKPLGHGTGLGLATVHGIVAQSGGAIVVEGGKGRGATFRVYLPRAAAEARDPGERREAPGARPAAAAGGKETLLVAEDESVVREMVRRALGELGYRVLAASDGVGALEAAEAHPGPIHLLLTDVVMPRMGGRELALAMRKRRPGTRVLYISGHTDDEALRSELTASGADFLSKPFETGELARRIRAVLDRK